MKRSNLIILFLLTISLSGCTANFMKAGSSAGKGGSPINAPAGNENLAPVTLGRVISSAVGGSTLDLIGDGSGSIGLNCPNDDQVGMGSIIGPSNCSCQFSYFENGSEKSVLAPTVYAESDLLRCSTGQLPANMPYVDVAIYIEKFDGVSNTIKIRQPGSNVDPTDPSTFLRADRYQCRNMVTIPYVFQKDTIYDPIQSEDPRLSVPLNFYTTNFGGSYALYANAEVKGWNCSSNPTTTDLDAGIDLSVYSRAPDELGSIRIFPPDGSANDRSTFFLAKSPTGIFNIPVNAFSAPTLVGGGTTASGDTVPPLGYGASPISDINGESCPDTVQIPSGFKWVKVWLFRASFEGRKYLEAAEADKMQSVTCNIEKGDDEGQALIKPCARGGGASAIPTSDAAGDFNKHAARWIYSPSDSDGQCIHFESHGTTDLSSYPCTDKVGPGCTTMTDTEWWDPKYETFPLGSDIWAAGDGCAAGDTEKYPFHVCNATHVPYDDAPRAVDLEKVNDGQLYDFLFVVTPKTVMTTVMQGSGSVNTAVDMYIPYRFLPGDCKALDPLNPEGPSDCSPSNQIQYEIKLHDAGLPSDPAGGTADRPGAFPVCALQPVSDS